MQVTHILFITGLLLTLPILPCSAKDKAPTKAAESAKKQQKKLEKAWLKVFVEIRKTTEEKFSKARKAEAPLNALQDQWIQALIAEEKRASKEIKDPKSKLVTVAQKQLCKVQLERLRLLLSIKKVDATRGLLTELLKNPKTRPAARRLQIAFARRDNPSRLAQIYQDILGEAGTKVPTREDPNFRLPPKTKQDTLIWIWSSGHPLARHNLTEYSRAMKSHGGQVFALELSREKKTKKRAIPGVTERSVDDSKGQTRLFLGISSNPLILLFNKKGEIVLVDPTAKELDAWLRRRKQGS